MDSVEQTGGNKAVKQKVVKFLTGEIVLVKGVAFKS